MPSPNPNDLLSDPIGDIDDVSLVSLEEFEYMGTEEHSNSCDEDLLLEGNCGHEDLCFSFEKKAMERETKVSQHQRSVTPTKSCKSAIDESREQTSPTETPKPVAAVSANAIASSPNTWNEWDVPLGRAQEVREHIGNVRFRNLVERHRPAYLKATRRSEKTYLSTKIHNVIQSNGGRFLDKKTTKRGEPDIWFEITLEKALAKISQALRTGTRPVRRHLPTHLETVPDYMEEKKNSASLYSSGNTSCSDYYGKPPSTSSEPPSTPRATPYERTVSYEAHETVSPSPRSSPQQHRQYYDHYSSSSPWWVYDHQWEL